MAAVGRAQETTTVANNVYDNNAKEVDPEKVRAAFATVIESNFNLIDDELKDLDYEAGVTLEQKFAGGLSAESVTLGSWAYESDANVNHNIGVSPISVSVIAVCTGAEHGYSPGDRVQVTNCAHNYENDITGGMSVDLSDINIAAVRFGFLIWVVDAGHDRRSITPANWDLVFNFIYQG